MILRRVIKHFRNQEWTAIGLDFVIVVAGVVVGIQVSNWNAARIDQARAIGYLERIGDNLDSDIADIKQRRVFWGQVADYGNLGLSYVETGETGEHSQWDLLLAYFQSSQVAELIPYQSTYDEILSAGELGLISSIELRKTLAMYYSFPAEPTVNDRPPYRQHVRGHIPIDIQIYIWNSCFTTSNVNEQELFPCTSPIDEARAAQIVDRISGDEVLMSELRYWMSTLHVVGLISSARLENALAIRATIEDEILHL